MGVTREQIEQISRFCLDFYKKSDFAHNMEHMNKTVKIAEFIAKKEKADLEIVRLGAMVHQFHDNIAELRGFLTKMNLGSNVTEKLVECAEFRPFKNSSKRYASVEAKVVFDADALQVLGPQGVVREIACNIKARNKPFHKSVTDARNIETLFYDALQTETAKGMIKEPHKLMKKFWATYDGWDNMFV